MATLEALEQALEDLSAELFELEGKGVEPPPELLAQLESFVEAERVKADAIGNLLMDLDERAGLCDKRAKEYRERSQKLERRRERLARFVARIMEVRGLKKLEGAEVTLTALKGREKVVVDDATVLPDDCWREPPPPEKVMDLAGMKVRLESGEVIPGARMGRGDPSLRVYR